MHIEARLRELGLVLPEPVKPPPGVRLPFAPVRVAITGRRVSPPLFESMEILGRATCLARLRAAR